jgi:hypothetical protein
LFSFSLKYFQIRVRARREASLERALTVNFYFERFEWLTATGQFWPSCGENGT